MKLLETMPDIIKINPFELKAADFQRFALWLDIIERLGRDQYSRLQQRPRELLPPTPPSEELETETVD